MVLGVERAGGGPKFCSPIRPPTSCQNRKQNEKFQWILWKLWKRVTRQQQNGKWARLRTRVLTLTSVCCHVLLPAHTGPPSPLLPKKTAEGLLCWSRQPDGQTVSRVDPNLINFPFSSLINSLNFSFIYFYSSLCFFELPKEEFHCISNSKI